MTYSKSNYQPYQRTFTVKLSITEAFHIDLNLMPVFVTPPLIPQHCQIFALLQFDKLLMPKAQLALTLYIELEPSRSCVLFFRNYQTTQKLSSKTPTRYGNCFLDYYQTSLPLGLNCFFCLTSLMRQYPPLLFCAYLQGGVILQFLKIFNPKIT